MLNVNLYSKIMNMKKPPNTIIIFICVIILIPITYFVYSSYYILNNKYWPPNKDYNSNIEKFQNNYLYFDNFISSLLEDMNNKWFDYNENIYTWYVNSNYYNSFKNSFSELNNIIVSNNWVSFSIKDNYKFKIIYFFNKKVNIVDLKNYKHLQDNWFIAINPRRCFILFYERWEFCYNEYE